MKYLGWFHIITISPHICSFPLSASYSTVVPLNSELTEMYLHPIQCTVNIKFAFSVNSMCFDKPTGIRKYPLPYYPTMGFRFTHHVCALLTSPTFLQHLAISDLFKAFVFSGISCTWCHTGCRLSIVTHTIQQHSSEGPSVCFFLP